MIITIDGPSGTGKSTVAKGVAKRLGFTFFDTGAMYRSLAWKILQEGVDPSDQIRIESEILPKFQYEIRSSGSERRYFVSGVDVTDQIRTQPISSVASQIATFSKVREEMVKIQRKFGHAIDAVFEGRDMGTVVFPDADLKIFLTADSEVRAERRYRELIQKFPDLQMSREEILAQIEKRDEADTTREISPLKQAKDAILIDTSLLSAHEVIEKIISLKPKRRFAKMKPFYKFIYLLARLYFKLFFRLRIYGLDHFRPGAGIVCSNHSSFFDPQVLSISCPEEVQFLARASLFETPLFGAFIRALNAHPIAKGSSDTQTFKLMIDLLSQGKKLILFPEGSRSIDGEIQPFQKGLAFLAQKAKCQVIPAYIDGAFAAWPRERKLPKLFGKIRVVFGSAIEWEEREDKKEAQNRITGQAESSVRALKSWLEKGANGIPP
jgi:cytidylate kinase